MLGIPCTLMLQWLLFGVVSSKETMISLVILLFGIAMSTVYDTNISVGGAALAVSAAIVTSLAQVLSQRLQSELGVPQIEYMAYLFPFSTILLLFIVPAFDNFDLYSRDRCPCCFCR